MIKHSNVCWNYLFNYRKIFLRTHLVQFRVLITFTIARKFAQQTSLHQLYLLYGNRVQSFFAVLLFKINLIFIWCHSQCPRQPERTPYQLIAVHSWATFSAAPDSDQCSRRPRRRKASWEHHRKRPLPGLQYCSTLFQCSPWSNWIKSPLWRGRNC